MKKKIDNPTPASTFAIHTSQPHNPKIAKELASLPIKNCFPLSKKIKNTVNRKNINIESTPTTPPLKIDSRKEYIIEV